MEEFLSVNDPFKVRPKHLNLILVEILTRSVLFFFFLLFCVCFLTFVGGLAALTFRSLCYYITHVNFSKSSGPEAAKHYTTATMFDLFDVLFIKSCVCFKPHIKGLKPSKKFIFWLISLSFLLQRMLFIL